MKRKRPILRAVARYWADVRAIKAVTGGSTASARKYWTRNVPDDGRNGISRKKLLRSVSREYSRRKRAAKRKPIEPVPGPCLPSVTLYPRENLPPPPLYDAFTLFDHKNGQVLAPVAKALKPGTSTLDVEFEFTEDGEPMGTSGRILLHFKWSGDGDYERYRSLYHAEVRSFIAAMVDTDESPEGSCLLHALTHGS